MADEHRILKAVSSLTDLDAVLSLVFRELEIEDRFDGALITLYDGRKGALFCRKVMLPAALRELERPYRGHKLDMSVPDFNVQSFTRREIIVADAAAIRDAYQQYREGLYKWGMNALAVVPIATESASIGTLVVMRQTGGIASSELDAIREALSLLGGPIRNAATLREQADRLDGIAVHADKMESLIDFIAATNQLQPLETIFKLILDELLKTFGFHSGLIWIEEDGQVRLKASLAAGEAHEETVRRFNEHFRTVSYNLDPPDGVVAAQLRKNEVRYVPDAMTIMHLDALYAKDRAALAILKTPRTTLHVPIQYRNRPIGIVTLGSLEGVIEVTDSDIAIIRSVGALIGTTLANAELFTQVETQKRKIEEFNLHLEDKVRAQTREIRSHLAEKSLLLEACDRFVPHEFLDLLGRESIKDITLGDNVEKRISVLFTDIRDFTAMSETLTPGAVFAFLNTYLSIMGPVMRKHGGFIDKYIGDAIMALFPTADSAVRAGLEMLDKLRNFNADRASEGLRPIRIGIGVNTGDSMLGTIGEKNRMEPTVISDAVNLASRIEGLTKIHKTPFLISAFTYNHLTRPDDYAIECVGEVAIRGKMHPVTLYSVAPRSDEC